VLSQTSLYAVQALAYLAEHRADEPVLARSIGEATGLPGNYLSKLMPTAIPAAAPAVGSRMCGGRSRGDACVGFASLAWLSLVGILLGNASPRGAHARVLWRFVLPGDSLYIAHRAR
jgi:hypothetical protein